MPLSGNVMNALLTYFSGTYTPIYAALYIGDPLSAGVEPNDVGNYVRCAITWGAPAAGIMANASTVLTFGISSVDWGTIDYIALFNSSTVGAGTLLGSGQLGSSQQVLSLEEISIAIGALTITTVF